MPEDRTTVRVSSDLLQDIRREKSFLTLEVNEHITNEDAISFLIVERILGGKTVFDLVEGINDIREHKGEKSSFSEAIREVAELLRIDPQERKSIIESLEKKYKEATNDSCIEDSYKASRGFGNEENGFLEGLNAMNDLPQDPLVEKYRLELER